MSDETGIVYFATEGVTRSFHAFFLIISRIIDWLESGAGKKGLYRKKEEVIIQALNSTYHTFIHVKPSQSIPAWDAAQTKPPSQPVQPLP